MAAPGSPAWSRGLPRGAVPPLVPILVPLVMAALVLGLVFARWVPLAPAGPELAAPRFTEVTRESGITFVHQAGAASPTALGGGVVVFDYDQDGAPDLFFVNTSAWPWEDQAGRDARTAASRAPDMAAAPALDPATGRCALFRNDGTGRFTDVSRAAGLDLALPGMSAAAGDFDGDGFPDLCVTGVGSLRLLRNRGDGTFADVTIAAGLDGEAHAWTTGAAWFDMDGDALLDLVVCRYARWPQGVPLELAFRVSDVGRSYGTPIGFVSAAPALYRNLGDGRFLDVAASAGLTNLDPLTGQPRAQPLVAAPLDANADGRLDLLLVHQSGDEVLFLSLGGGRFREWSAARDARREGNSTGLVAAGAFPFNAANQPGGRLATLRDLAQLSAAPPAPATGGSEPWEWTPLARLWATALLDYEFDGRIEAVVTRATLSAAPASSGPRDFAAGALALFDERQGRWRRAPDALPASDPSASPSWSRAAPPGGIAVADLDGDGDGDLVLAPRGAPARVVRNDQPPDLPWLRVQLRGPADALGARVEVHTPRRVHLQTVEPALGYFAQSENVLTFGLGEDARVRRIVIRWPSGETEEIPAPPINRLLQFGPSR